MAMAMTARYSPEAIAENATTRCKRGGHVLEGCAPPLPVARGWRFCWKVAHKFRLSHSNIAICVAST